MTTSTGQASSSGSMTRVTSALRWGSLAQVLQFLHQLAVVPLFLSAWGADVYGGWLTVSAAVAYLGFADGGMMQYIGNRLTRSHVAGDASSFSSDLADASLMYCGIGVLSVVVGAALSSSTALMPDSVSTVGLNVAWVVFLLSLQVGAGLGIGFVSSLYRVLGLMSVGQRVSALQRAALLVVTIALLWLGRGPGSMALAHLLVSLAFLAHALFDVGRRDPRFAPTLKGALLSRAVRLLGPSLLYLLVILAYGLTVQGTLLAVSSALGATAVVLFSTTRTMANVVRQFVTLVANSSFGELSSFEAAGDRHRLVRAHRLLVKGCAFVCLLLVVPLFASGPGLYEWWTRGFKSADVLLLRLLLVDQLASTPAFVTGILLVASSRLRAYSMMSVGVGVLQVTLTAVLAPSLGLSSVGVVVLSTSLLVSGTVVPMLASELTEESLGDYARWVYGPLALAATISLGAAWGLSSLLASRGMSGLVAAGALSALVAALAGWGLLLGDEGRAAARSAARHLAGRFGRVI